MSGINAQAIRTQQIENELEMYFRLDEQEARFKVLLRDKTENKEHYALLVDQITLNLECPIGFEEVMESPENFFAIADQVAQSVQRFYFESRDERVDDMTMKRIHCRIHNYCNMLGNVLKIYPGVEAINKFAAYEGTVIKVKQMLVAEKSREYTCSTCHLSIYVAGKLSRGYFYEKTYPSSSKCPNECPNGRMKMVESEITRNDLHRLASYQEIVLQENDSSVSEAGCGGQPKTILVILENDLVDSCIPGDQVTIFISQERINLFKRGHMFVKIKELKKSHKIQSEYALYANNLEVKTVINTNAVLTAEKIAHFQKFWEERRQDPFEGRNFILKSLCPEIFGMYFVKLAVGVFFARGNDRVFQGNEKLRSNAHALLVGDPGVAKTRFLLLAKRLIPQSRYLVGLGTTRAGLTVSVQLKDSRWEIEAGAAMLSKGGFCCVDEFRTLSAEAQQSLHECMEQQTITIAKAQTNTSLKTNFCVFGATNPPEKKSGGGSESFLSDAGGDGSRVGEMYNYDYQNLKISHTLLTRFDIILYLKDIPNEEWDSQLADALLLDRNTAHEEGLWNESDLKIYFLYIRKFNPKMTEDAYDVIKRYYLKQRQNAAETDAPRKTFRLFESLMRISTNHARLLMKERVEVYDAVTAVMIIDRSFIVRPLVSTDDDIVHTKFPANAKEAYAQDAFNLLYALDANDLWEKERIYLESLSQESTDRGAPSQVIGQRHWNEILSIFNGDDTDNSSNNTF